MKKKLLGMLIFLFVGFLFVTAFPVLSSDKTQASTLQAIQLEIQRVAAQLARIVEMVGRLIAMQSAPQEQVPVVSIPEEVKLPSDTEEKTASTSEEIMKIYPLFESLPLISTSSQGGLIVLYRFSITAGTEQAVLESVQYRITYGDVSLRDLEVHAFSDPQFSKRAFNEKPIGKLKGYLQGGESRGQLPLNAYGAITIPAGETRYFEIHGTTSGKNINAFVTTSIEDLPAVTVK